MSILHESILQGSITQEPTLVPEQARDEPNLALTQTTVQTPVVVPELSETPGNLNLLQAEEEAEKDLLEKIRLKKQKQRQAWDHNKEVFAQAAAKVSAEMTIGVIE